MLSLSYFSVLILSLCFTFAKGSPLAALGRRSPAAFSASLPITRGAPPSSLGRRQGLQSSTGVVGLGDGRDRSYSIQVSINSVSVPVIFDTGSSDLWSISSGCTASSCGMTSMSTPKIPASSLKPSGMDIALYYGDSAHPTAASGMIGSGPVSVAGLQLNDQFLAAVDNTSTRLSDKHLSGIFGMGFPNPLDGSEIFRKLMTQRLGSPQMPTPPADAAFTDAFIDALPAHGPLVSRMVANGQLERPIFTVTLQREDIEIGGNVGQLTVGKLPDGVSPDSLTWVPVRLYSVAEGGLAGSTRNPKEVFPARWEIPIDDVILNGRTLPKPNLNGVTYTALIDSGTSFMAGPQDVVSSIYDTIALPGSLRSPSTPPAISCTAPVDLTFVIGGKQFPVDPRDFLSYQSNVKECNAMSLLPTDPPSSGRLMSWILGDPFMKSNLIAFYYGNLTDPSTDPPRMGFLSTVPGDANSRLGEDVKSAEAAGRFVAASVTAPATSYSPASTDSHGVGQAQTGLPVPAVSNKKSGALPLQAHCAATIITTMLLSALLL